MDSFTKDYLAEKKQHELEMSAKDKEIMELKSKVREISSMGNSFVMTVASEQTTNESSIQE